MSQPKPTRPASNAQQHTGAPYTYPASIATNAATQGSARDVASFGTHTTYSQQGQHIPSNGNIDVSFAGSQFAGQV